MNVPTGEQATKSSVVNCFDSLDDADSGSDDDIAELMVLYPGERRPILTYLPKKITVKEAVPKMIASWKRMPRKQECPAIYWHYLAGSDSVGEGRTYLWLIGISPKRYFSVSPTVIIEDLLSSNPSFSKKGGDFFTFMITPVVVNVAFYNGVTAEAAKVIVDAKAPLMTMIPLFEAAFDTEPAGGFCFGWFTSDNLTKWVNCNFSLAEHHILPDDFLVLFAMAHFFQKENPKPREKALAEGVVHGTALITKSSGLLGAAERYFVLSDCFLIICHNHQDAPASYVLPLDYYTVSLCENGSSVAVLLRPITTFKNFRGYSNPVMISLPQEQATRELFSRLHKLSRTHEKTCIFGVELQDIAARTNFASLVPTPVQDLVTALYHKAAYMNMVFQDKAKPAAVERLAFQLDLGLPVNLLEEDPLVLAEVLKRLLYALPSPVLPTAVLDAFNDHFKSTGADPDLVSFKEMITGTPAINQATLAYLLHFLSMWAIACQINLQTVASICAPFLLHLSVQAQQQMNQLTLLQLVYMFLRHRAEVLAHDRQLPHQATATLTPGPSSVSVAKSFLLTEKRHLDCLLRKACDEQQPTIVELEALDFSLDNTTLNAEQESAEPEIARATPSPQLSPPSAPASPPLLHTTHTSLSPLLADPDVLLSLPQPKRLSATICSASLPALLRASTQPLAHPIPRKPARTTAAQLSNSGTYPRLPPTVLKPTPSPPLTASPKCATQPAVPLPSSPKSPPFSSRAPAFMAPRPPMTPLSPPQPLSRVYSRTLPNPT
eukprot:TRINITY_DN2407_c0_g1_i4.p2 TRINITY_DN2407_c0_g1~~TRINITY_DN2407_c0_g1_i4.p2  ORF type:complete len:776 (-),score=165.91 TRINITY_DN2407_c0_g1_i4:97-2424(-)